MLGDPIAGVAEPVGELREIERVAQRDRARGAGDTGERSRTERGVIAYAWRDRARLALVGREIGKTSRMYCASISQKAVE